MAFKLWNKISVDYSEDAKNIVYFKVSKRYFLKINLFKLLVLLQTYNFPWNFNACKIIYLFLYSC